MPQRLGFIARPKWWLVLCCLVVGLALIIGLPDSQVRAQSITITVPQGKTGFILLPNTASQSLITTTGSVTSDVPYDVTVKDKMEVDDGSNAKDAGDAGQMVEYTNANLWVDASKIADVVSVDTTHASKVVSGLPHDVTASDFTIITGATAATNDNLFIAVTIDTVGGDVALTEAGHWYKVTITFTASAN